MMKGQEGKRRWHLNNLIISEFEQGELNSLSLIKQHHPLHLCDSRILDDDSLLIRYVNRIERQ